MRDSKQKSQQEDRASTSEKAKEEENLRLLLKLHLRKFLPDNSQSKIPLQIEPQMIDLR